MSLKPRRETRYKRELKRVEVSGANLERILRKKSKSVEIRFSYWVPNHKGNVQMMPRPLDLSEDNLLLLLEKAIKEGVLSEDFSAKLYGMLATHAYSRSAQTLSSSPE